MATVPYPHVGASQHLCLVRHPRGKRPSQPALMLDWQRLQDTVLASAFCGRTMAIPTGLPAPYDVLELPDLRRGELREQIVLDVTGAKLGYLLHVPGLYVHANQVLANVLAGNDRYNYAWALPRMVAEAAHQLCGVLKRSVLRVREKPGIMAHAQDVEALPPDCIGISEEFATKLLPQIQEPLPWITCLWDLDGFPVYAVRFPLANEWGIQEMTLRILPGRGRYIAANPWTLGKRWLGDVDGDCLFALLRVNEVREKLLEIRHYRADERIIPDREIRQVRGRLTLPGIRNPASIPGLDPKTLDRIDARFDTLERRQQAIEAADTRGMVAIFTMVAWWIGRILATRGGMTPQEAHRRAYNAVEWLLEQSFDSRKGGAEMSGASFNAYGFAEILMRGGEELPLEQLQAIGAPETTLSTLALAWRLANSDLRGCCAESPVYETFVLQRGQMERACERLLWVLREQGVPPAAVYRHIVDDLFPITPDARARADGSQGGHISV